MIGFLEEAERLIRINSVSQDGNEEIAIHLQSLMRRMGFKTSLQEVNHSIEGVSKRQFNVIGILGDPLVDSKTRKGFLLNAHTDTVSPGIRAYWTETGGDPFQAVIKEDRIYGLGTADVKLDFLCKLKACERYVDRKLRMPVYLVGSCGEEIGMLGSKFLIKSKILNPRFVLVGEPSELAVIAAHKAYAVYRLSIGFNQLDRDAKGFNTRLGMKCAGKSAHGSYPHLGDNALLRMLSTIRRIREANFQIRLSRLGGGDSVNKVPDSAFVEFFLSSSSFDDFKRFYREKLATDPDSGKIQIEFGGIGESGVCFLPGDILEAIDAMRDAVESLREEALDGTDESFNPSASTMNLGKITHAPGSIELFWDFRLLPAVDAEGFDAKLKAAIAAVNARFPNMIMKAARQRFTPALNMREDSELVQAALDAQRIVGIKASLDKKATSTEAAQYFAAGYDAIVFGPGKSMGNSHSPNEHNLVEHLDRAVHFYDRMIERFCL
ncbi:MAG: M20/M25/M40 family metallo-hydrolase [Deltaproteobacteria bacterium]|nr:M20/M25/M40 family metallo-hydrolase [Deltaproteobacteria bacterium]